MKRSSLFDRMGEFPEGLAYIWIFWMIALLAIPVYYILKDIGSFN